MPNDDGIYALHSFLAQPVGWEAVAEAVDDAGSKAVTAAGGAVYGAWRSQIGRPRDLVTVITRWNDLSRRHWCRARTWLMNCQHCGRRTRLS